MAIEFKHNGQLWRADTIDEAVELRRRLHAEDLAAFESGEGLPYEHQEQVWTHDTVTDLLKNAGPLQRRLLRVLSDNSGITSEDLVEKLKLDSEVSLAGVLSGLSKRLKKLSLKPSDLYSVEVSWKAKGKTRNFSLMNEFCSVAGELGWPEKWPS